MVSCLVFVGASRLSAVGGVMLCYARGESGAPRPTTPEVSTVLQHLNTSQPSRRQGRAGYQNRLQTPAVKVM